MPSDSDFNFQYGRPQPSALPDRPEDRPLRILIMGDFSGRGHRGQVAGGDELALRPLVAVDIDNFDQVLARYAPTLDLTAAGTAAAPAVIPFQELDDFHPDRLLERVDLFQSMREMRRRLLNPATFQETAAQLRQASAGEASDVSGPQKDNSAESTADSESDREMLSRLLGNSSVQGPPARNPGRREEVDLSRLIRDIVQPHIVPDAAPDEQQLIASVDLAISAEMRRLLHDPSFQALESIWRGVRWLLTELEVGEDLQLYLLDVSREELHHDFTSAAGDVAAAGVYRRIVQQEVSLAGGQPWSLIVGHYSFGSGDEDCALLAALGQLASQAGGPMIAAASPRLLGCDSLAAAPDPKDWPTDLIEPASDAGSRWRALRQSPVAPWLGLALPRLLLRLPYGERTDELDLFRFEEMSAPRQHEEYLWGNPALACALLIGKSFLEQGWSLEPGDDLEIGGLPAHTYESAGEKALQACAEICLGERAADFILGLGLMPLMSYRNRNAVRLLRFQSLADPPHPLAGPW